MIVHASIPADDPERVARAIAELWRGVATSFPPIPGSWLALADDGKGTEIEVCPRRQVLVPGAAMAEFVDQPIPKYGASHLLIETKLGAEEVLAIGQREGWLVRRCRRGGPGAMGFDLIELWVENAFMLEVATAEMYAGYVAFYSGPAQAMLGIKQAA